MLAMKYIALNSSYLGKCAGHLFVIMNYLKKATFVGIVVAILN